MNSVTEFVRTLGAARLAAMGAVAAGLIGFFVFVMVRVAQPQMTVLFTDLQFADSIEVVKKLEGLNVPYEVRQDGAIVLVPKDRVLRLRMELAENGLPAGGTVGYEIFDKTDTLGATSFIQNVNRKRAIEGELGRTIRALDRVQMARVHLVLPQRKLFARSKSEPSASIVVKMRGSLDGGQIKAIQHLVASAIEGLKPNRVSIVDDKGKLLASGQDDADGLTATSLDERNRAFERRVQAQIEDIVSSVVGSDRARVRVTAELDYNRVTQTSDLFDPDGQVVRSTQTREESSSATATNGDGSVSVGNELPSAADEGGAGQGDKETSQKTEEVVNYEISRTTKTEVVEAGRIKRLSVAVLVDGIYTKTNNGTLTYVPRPQEQLDQIAELVRSAIGFDRERGDHIHVANLRFADGNLQALADAGEDGFLSLSKTEYFYIAELVVIVLVTLLVLLFVVRPLVRRIVTPEDPPPLEELTLPAPNASGPLALSGEADGADGDATLVLENATGSRTAEAVKTAKLQGEAQAMAVREVGEVITNNPDEAITIVRDWIHSTA